LAGEWSILVASEMFVLRFECDLSRLLEHAITQPGMFFLRDVSTQLVEINLGKVIVFENMDEAAIVLVADFPLAAETTT